jgi:ribosomal protein S19
MYDRLIKWKNVMKFISKNDPDIKKIIDIERTTNIKNSVPISIWRTNITITNDSSDITFCIKNSIRFRFFLIKTFMFGHKFGEFILHENYLKKKEKKKIK